MYGATANDLASMIGRFFGSALIAVAIIVFMARDVLLASGFTYLLFVKPAGREESIPVSEHRS